MPSIASDGERNSDNVIQCSQCGRRIFLAGVITRLRCPVCRTWIVDDEVGVNDIVYAPSPIHSVSPQAHWRALHRYAYECESWTDESARVWFASWEATIPNINCSCREHWRTLTTSMPPDFASRDAFFGWSVRAHNSVNDRLEKPILTVGEALAANGIMPEVVQIHAGRDAIAVTSFNPREIDRQSRAIKSWRDVGLRIVAVQSAGEAELVRDQFDVDDVFVREHSTDAYDRPTQRIVDILRAVGDDCLIINSDIEILGDATLLFPSDGISCGIRWNYDKHYRTAYREGWGIDAFYLKKEHIDTLPDTPLAIGRPIWDYWLPWHFERLGVKLNFVADPVLFHKMHPIGWSQTDLVNGRAWIDKIYGVEVDWLSLRGTWPYCGN